VLTEEPQTPTGERLPGSWEVHSPVVGSAYYCDLLLSGLFGPACRRHSAGNPWRWEAASLAQTGKNLGSVGPERKKKKDGACSFFSTDVESRTCRIWCRDLQDEPSFIASVKMSSELHQDGEDHLLLAENLRAASRPTIFCDPYCKQSSACSSTTL
jgi:hypothetical protein